MNITHKILNGLAGISIAIFFSNFALANDVAPDASQNIKQKAFQKYTQKQNQRIKQGIQSGELTAGETKRLVKQQRDIRLDARRFNADGTITKRERRHLGRDMKRSNRSIFKAKHNNNKSRPRI